MMAADTTITNSKTAINKTMQVRNIKKFDGAFNLFTKEKDPILHHNAIKELLKIVDLEEEYEFFSNNREEIGNFFKMWERAERYEENPAGKKGLKKIGILSKKLYGEKRYGELCGIFCDMVFRNFADLFHLRERNDFEELTDIDLYSKNIIPSEITVQYFLIETMVKNPDFDWKRGEKIANQNLACFIVCFADIYEFLNEEYDDEPVDNKKE